MEPMLRQDTFVPVNMSKSSHDVRIIGRPCM